MIRKNPLIFVFWSYRENFIGTQKKKKKEFELDMVNEPLVFKLLRLDYSLYAAVS